MSAGLEQSPVAPSGVAPDDIVISVRNVGKMYRIYNQPQDRLKHMLFWRFGKQYGRDFWALRNISFDIRRGETMGIIGRNGSGKSTLLQIIAGTLAPTEGESSLLGRVAALLELGSGFNPEFSGRENVYLNGAILGLSRDEMQTRFEEIVAFADIGEFIDQPVKFYSSGMAVRLAFAVQTKVPKDVLIVDEALAVGDEAFRRKCMRELDAFRDSGGTVLMVSHDAQTIIRQCDRALLLQNGRMIVCDEAKPVVDLYQKLLHSSREVAQQTIEQLQAKGLRAALIQEHAPDDDQTSVSAQFEQISSDEWFDPDLPQPDEVVYGTGEAIITDFGIYNSDGTRVNTLRTGRRYTWVYHVDFHCEAHAVRFGTMLKTIDGIDVAGISSSQQGGGLAYVPLEGRVRVTFDVQLNLGPGTYYLNAGVAARKDAGEAFLQRRVDMCAIKVLPSDWRDSYGLAFLDPMFRAEIL